MGPISAPAGLLRLAGALVLVTAVVTIVGPSIQAQRPQTRRPRGSERIGGRLAAAGEVIVRLRPSAAAPSLTAALDTDVSEQLGSGLRRLRSRRFTTGELLDRLRGHADVASVEPNYQVHVAAMPNDPLATGQWAFRAPGAGGGIDAVGAWGIATGSHRFVTGVIDTGVDYTHPDLRDNIWTAPSAFSVTIGGVTVACAAGTHGFDAIAMTCDPMDAHGHGTRMAGVIGAIGNNRVGVSGVNWATSIMPLRFMDSRGTGWHSDAIKAMEFAIQVRNAFASARAAEVRVLSNSWTGGGYSDVLEAQISRAGAHDMLVVTSAGNDATDMDVFPAYPASFELPNLLSVAATDDLDRLEPYSNYGALTVDIAAPGSQIMSTQLGGGYSASSGTSPAGAFAAGGAALLLSHCSITTLTLRNLIVSSVDVTGTLGGRTKTGGRLNVGRALRSCSRGNTAPSVALVSPSDQQRFTTPASVAIVADAADSDGAIARVDFFVGTTHVGSDTSAPFAITWRTSIAGTYRIRAVATDGQGATAETITARTIVVESLSALPAPWAGRDIGAVGVAGTSAASGPAMAVEGGGADVWGTADAFRFVYQPLAGDGRVTARVASVENVDAWTKAGVMIRSALQPDAAHAFLMVTPGKGLAFQRRAAAGGVTIHSAAGAGVAPQWIRLERRGQVVTALTSPNGSTWTIVGQSSVALGSTAYVGLAVSSHRAGVLAYASFDAVTVSAGVLPSGWSNRDVGAVGVAGRARDTSGTFTVDGAGADVWGTADAFHFAYKALPADGEVIARVAGVENVNAWTKAGVMMRQSLQPGSAHAFMMVTPGKGLAFQRRRSANATSEHTSGGAGAAPRWVRLTRAGQTVRAYHSPDGSTWTLVGTTTLSISGTVYAGVAVSSHTTADAATATFTGVVVR